MWWENVFGHVSVSYDGLGKGQGGLGMVRDGLLFPLKKHAPHDLCFYISSNNLAVLDKLGLISALICATREWQI